MTVRDKVRRFMQEQMARDMSAVGDEQSLLESGTIDSVGVMSLVAFLEQEYGITVDDDDLMPENFDTVAAVVRFVERKGGAASA